ncbi:cell division protein FtsA [Candidatus Cytomitobacter primus]|uniref:SHS2 domain-containing protein n=1 Tax=Candidatus Cytomitobacter primus TaxID=2066024 RepID=A0A5C0UEJ4_9PROT|nr:hypothetical protein [Candidatus Cytomitobacter primus]QEK38516.1 hypothetical protein FZC34_01165 [Candidatus Cytomitobacter primus]
MYRFILKISDENIIGCVVNELNKKIATNTIDLNGFSNGNISDFYKFQKCIYDLVKNLEHNIKVKLKDTVILLPSEQIQITYFSTKIKMKSAFSKEHMQKMIHQLYKICEKNELYLIKYFPCTIKLDNQKLDNPIGMYGKICEITWSTFYIPTNMIKNFNTIFSNLYLKVIDYSIHDYELIDSILDFDEKKLGSTIINIKNDHTMVFSIKNNIPIQILNIPNGYNNIDHEMAIKLNITISQAKSLRQKYCSGILNEDDKNHHIKLYKRTESENTISQYEINQKTLPSIKKLISNLKNQLENKVDENNRLFFIGEFAEISSIEVLLKKYFQQNIYLFNNSNITNLNMRSIQSYINKTQTQKKNPNHSYKFYHYILLGLKKIYDMIKKWLMEK